MSGATHMRGRRPDGTPETGGAEMRVLPQRVRIQYDRCVMRLILPGCFELLSIGRIKKIFGLVKKRPDQNEDAFAALDPFFLLWETGYRERCRREGVRIKDGLLKHIGKATNAYLQMRQEQFKELRSKECTRTIR